MRMQRTTAASHRNNVLKHLWHAHVEELLSRPIHGHASVTVILMMAITKTLGWCLHYKQLDESADTREDTEETIVEKDYIWWFVKVLSPFPQTCTCL